MPITDFTHCQRCAIRWDCIDSRPLETGRIRRYRCPNCGALKHTQETEIQRGFRRIKTEQHQ